MISVSRSLAPRNLLTVSEWSRFAGAVGRRAWMGGVRFYVQQSGAALVLKANDDLVVFAKHVGGKISQKTYKAGSWGWAA